jgi:adenylate cyclase
LADVFISYARGDQPMAGRVAKGMQAAGFDVWWDADLPAHRSYSEVIELNLEEAKAVVVLWSKTAAQSQWVRAEADFARNAGTLVQATVDGSIPPLPFNQIQCANLKGWRGTASHSGWAKLQGSVDALVSGEEKPRGKPAQLPFWDRVRANQWVLAGAFTLVLAALALFLFFARPGEERKPVLAVLPFRTLDSRDASLVAGMWEDTRQAIGRNPQLVVLGPNTAEQLAEKGEGAAKKAADYLLQASVRTAGDRIRVSADLVRTKDGEQLWSQDFDRKLDDVFALQSEIAREIEGRIRGRLAMKGGKVPEHIATSADVYALYNDARAKLRQRDYGPLAIAARQELEQVVKMDPNFAPGWAALSQASGMTVPSQRNWQIANPLPEQYARRAIDLAPNLAAGHGALAVALDLKGPVARAEVERAVELDPNDYQAILWLGNMRGEAGDKKGALEAYRRALSIEPLFWPAVMNAYSTMKSLGDDAGVNQLIEDEQRVGGEYFGTSIRIDQAMAKGNLAEAMNLGLAYWDTGNQEGRQVIGMSLGNVMFQLGFSDEVRKMGPFPDFGPYLWKNDPKGLDMLESHHIDDKTFFSLNPLTENAGRVYLLSGRSARLAERYLALKMPLEEFSKLGDPEHFLFTAPLIAVALKENGHAKEAADLLSYAEQQVPNAPKDIAAEVPVLLARILAAQGRNQEALPPLAGAVRRGWLPQPPMLQSDLHFDPALKSLYGNPQFEDLRNQILGTIARERAKVDPSLLKKLDAISAQK